jgi:GT2 family glycosyltransferase/tetratricopeptide (TPR) repeat protein
MSVPLRYLVGPLQAERAWACFRGPREAGLCRAFNTSGDADLTWGFAEPWEAVRAHLPDDWEPDFIALWGAYAAVPPAVYALPVPVVLLACDWDLLWQPYRRLAPLCELLLTDVPGVRAFARAGHPHARPAILYGLEPPFLGPQPDEEGRDIDLLFVGNLHPAVQRRRLRLLGRLARLSGRFRVFIAEGIHGEDYRRLLGRARVVFNHSLRGEANKRVFEAVAAGALLLQERDNTEVPGLLADREECVYYTEDDLEDLLVYYLTREGERRRIAHAARARLEEFTFASFWEKALETIAAELPELQRRREARPALSPREQLLLRTWQSASSAAHDDHDLLAELGAAVASCPQDAELHNALGLAAALPHRSGGRMTAEGARAAAGHFRRAVAADPFHVTAALNLVECLIALENQPLAAQGARHLLALLDRVPISRLHGLDSPRFPPDFDIFRVEWQRTASGHADSPSALGRAREALLRWRLHSLLADLTGELLHHHEAALLRPDLPATRAALGCALGRAGRPREAVPHLRAATEADPFDLAAARACFQALGEAGEEDGARRLARDRRLLARAAPGQVPAEDWFMQAPPVGDEPASLLILCCNEAEVTRQCLESVLRHTRPPYELVLVDNGSGDDTPALLEAIKGREGPDRVEVIRNDENLGFARGCNQALRAARGAYLVLLNNDTVVTPGWLEGLIRHALSDYPNVGMVGPVTNYSRPPQLVEPGYTSLDDLDAFALRRRKELAGQTLEAERLAGFCLLLRREVLDGVGALDESFGVGFFEDDDLCVRVRRAGYKLLVAQEVFVHHHGSRTFRNLGLDTTALLRDNLERFRAKWGPAEAAGYRLPSGEGRQDTGPAPTAVLGEGGGARPRVSLCLIVKDEEDNLPACLGSAADLVDEVVVVDTGSADRTREVAARFGARVDSFAAARNQIIEHARGEWIFWLDADDRLDEDNRAKLRQLFSRLPGGIGAYSMKCLCLPDPVSRTATVVDHIRLFSNYPAIRWQYRVHEQILPAVRKAGGTVRFADVVIHHTGYQDPALRGRKLQRDLRLLRLEDEEHPDDPFTLFNLGSVYQELGDPEGALPLLRRSLERSHPRDSIVRKLYALMVGCHRRAGRPGEALSLCEEGLGVCPDDTELLFVHAVLLKEKGDLPGAEGRLQRLLTTRPGAHFASVDAGLRGYKARHNLAVLYRQSGRDEEALGQWRQALAERPDFVPAWLGAAEVHLRQGQWQMVEEVAGRLEGLPGGGVEAPLLRARAHLARGEFGLARSLLEGVIARAPGELAPRVILTHVLLQEGADLDAAERALRAVLELAPEHPEARHNLALLLRQKGEAARDALFTTDVGLAAPVYVESWQPAPLPPPSDHEETAEAGPPVRVAVLAVARNEEGRIGRFLSHYLGLGADAVYVLDDGSTDRTAEVAGGFPGVVVSDLGLGEGEPDDQLRAEALDAYRRACAGQFDWVLVVGVDEVVVPREGTLKETLARHPDEEALGCSGAGVEGRPVALRPGCPAPEGDRPHAAVSPFRLLRDEGTDPTDPVGGKGTDEVKG